MQEASEVKRIKKIRWYVKKAKLFLCTPRWRIEGTVMAPRIFNLRTSQR